MLRFTLIKMFQHCNNDSIHGNKTRVCIFCGCDLLTRTVLYLCFGYFHIWMQVEHFQQRSGASFSHPNNYSSGQPLLGAIMGS